MKYYIKSIVPQLRGQRIISVLLVLFMTFSLVGIARGASNNIYSDDYSSTFGLRDEPAMFSASGNLSDIQSLRVDVMLYGKRQTLAGQQALGFLILRSYVVYDDSMRSGFRITDKFNHWKKGANAETYTHKRGNTNPWLGKIWNVESTWTTRPGVHATWHFTVSTSSGQCIVTVRGKDKFNCKMEGKYLLKWTDDRASHKKVDYEFWLSINDEINGKFKITYYNGSKPDKGTYERAK